MDKITENLSKTPCSSSTIHEPERKTKYSASYRIISINGVDVTANISSTYLGLVCAGRGINQGFYKAHKLFLPEKIFSILFGEVEYKETKEVFAHALES